MSVLYLMVLATQLSEATAVIVLFVDDWKLSGW